ncbi:MAG: hypothetical protein CML42_08010 [Rhodobacteraceae bacterium]|nr:hypothetical protein [Paracoccaceae bacterium]|tara:strand:+ start:12739 stop:13608 length:870 start_codon:yes stop_codon:yes gene_type:complete
MSEGYLKSLNDYYELKAKYDKSYKDSKISVKKSNLPERTKVMMREFIFDDDIKEDIQQINRKCVGCEKNVGTIFMEDSRMLKAICGDMTNPCPLNIEINLEETYSISELYKKQLMELEVIKQKIIRKKLDLLFGLEKEDIVVSEFEKLKEEFNQLNDFLLSLEEKISNNSLITNPDNDKKIKKKEMLESLNKELMNNINEFKKSINDYRNTKNTSQVSNRFLNDGIELYINKITTGLKRIRNISYEYMEMEVDITENEWKPPFYLIKKNLKQNKNEITMKEGSVISNIK